MLLFLSADAIAKSGNATRRSSREIASATKSSRSAVQNALDALALRGIITTREGNQRAAAAHILPFLELKKIGGPFAGPPPRERGPIAGPHVARLQDHPGPEAGPPRTENTSPPCYLDIEPDRLKTLDRVLTARPEDFERGTLGTVRARITWFHEKHGSRENAPDAQMCAGILAACGSIEGLDWLCIELHSSRQQGGGGAWWRAVALQRIQQIPAKVTAQRVAEWKNHRRPKIVAPATVPAPPAIAENPLAASPTESNAGPEEVHNWAENIAALAAGKRL